MNKTRKIEITVELIRIVAAVAIAYAIALLTLVAGLHYPAVHSWTVLFHETSGKCYQPRDSVYIYRTLLLLYVCGEQVQPRRRGNIHGIRLPHSSRCDQDRRYTSAGSYDPASALRRRTCRNHFKRDPGFTGHQVQCQHRRCILNAEQHACVLCYLGIEIQDA